jgi:tetratricopeptide (TPR) repeat protein
MLRQFNRFLVVVLICCIALYVTLKNSEQATIKLGSELSITTYAGLIYIGTFVLGCITSSLVALFFGLKGYLRERKLRAHERSRQLFFELFIRARGLMAGQEWGAAREIWEKVLRQDNTNVIARVELAHCLESLGDPKEALRILNETRAGAKPSPEVLYKAAHLNRKLGNNTAASDNIALLVKILPSRTSLELARDNAAALGDVEAALDYQLQVEHMGYSDTELERAKVNLLVQQATSTSSDLTQRATSLSSILKRHPTHVATLETLADTLLSLGKVEETAECLVKAAKLSEGDVLKWQRVVDFWLATAPGDFLARAERALAAARSATKETRGSQRVEAELLLASTMLRVNRPAEALKSAEGLQALAEREGVRLSNEIVQRSTAILGVSLARLGKTNEAANLWQQLALLNDRGSTLSGASGNKLLESRAEPSPTLSTP